VLFVATVQVEGVKRRVEEAMEQLNSHAVARAELSTSFDQVSASGAQFMQDLKQLIER